MIIKHPILIIKQHGTIKIIDTLETYQLHHIIHLYNVFRENDGKENCAQLIEKNSIKC